MTDKDSLPFCGLSLHLTPVLYRIFLVLADSTCKLLVLIPMLPESHGENPMLISITCAYSGSMFLVFSSICSCVCGHACMHACMYKGYRTIYGNLFSPSIFWILGVELMSSSRFNNHMHPFRHLSCPVQFFSLAFYLFVVFLDSLFIFSRISTKFISYLKLLIYLLFKK